MKTTRQVALELKIGPAALRAHIGAGHVRPPTRRVGPAYLWTAREIEAARQALAVPGRRRTRPAYGDLGDYDE